MLRVPTHREPTHPGDMLLEEFLEPMGSSILCIALDQQHRIGKLLQKQKNYFPATSTTLRMFTGRLRGLMPLC